MLWRNKRKQGGVSHTFLFTARLSIMGFVLLGLSVFSHAARAQAVPDSTLFLSPDTTSINVGDDFSLDAMIDPGNNEAVAVALSVSFDHAVLRLDSVDTTGSPFQTVLRDALVDNANGNASVVVGVTPSNPPAPVITTSRIATLGFHVIGAGDTTVTMNETSQVAALDVSGNAAVTYLSASVLSFDTTTPTLTETTPVPEYINNSTPDYTFTTDEAGTITYGGDCSSSVTNAIVGENTVTFNSLSDGMHDNCAITVTDAFGNVSSPLAVSSFTVDTTLPTVSINNLTDGETVSGNVNLTATASDATNIAGVQFLLDGNNLGSEDTQAPYEMVWDTTGVSDGPHTLTAVARDTAGNEAESGAISVIVQNGGGGSTPIFEDDFESALSWEQSGNVTWYTGNPKNGSHSVQLRKTGTIEKTVSLEGYKNITVSFEMGARSLDKASENVQALYFDGSSWQVLEQIDNGSAGENNQLNPYSISLPASVNDLQTFALRFKINGSGTGDYGYVDDVSVSGEIIP